MRYDSRLIKMASALGITRLMGESAPMPRSFFERGPRSSEYGERSMEKYRKKRKVRNKMARESRRKNRHS